MNWITYSNNIYITPVCLALWWLHSDLSHRLWATSIPPEYCVNTILSPRHDSAPPQIWWGWAFSNGTEEATIGYSQPVERQMTINCLLNDVTTTDVVLFGDFDSYILLDIQLGGRVTGRDDDIIGHRWHNVTELNYPATRTLLLLGTLILAHLIQSVGPQIKPVYAIVLNASIIVPL